MPSSDQLKLTIDQSFNQFRLPIDKLVSLYDRVSVLVFYKLKQIKLGEADLIWRSHFVGTQTFSYILLSI